MNKAPSIMNPVGESDWNFDAVPDNELVGCCYWEYARESVFIRDTLSEMRADVLESVKLNRNLENSKRPGWCDKLSRIQSIGYTADVFVRGSLFEPRAIRQSIDPRKPNFRHPDAPPLTGSFPAPWQSMDEAERKNRARIKTVVEDCHIVPVRLGQWHDAREIVRYCEGVVQRDSDEWNAWKREYTRCDEEGHLHALPNVPEPPSHKPIRPGLFIASVETLLIEIAWEDFTNDEIANYFRQWLKHARPKQIKAPSGKGHKPGDWRSLLTRLGVMRLLSRFTLKEILGTRSTTPVVECQPIHRTKQFASDKWGDPAKWHDARRDAGKIFHTLFPFLPKDEKPISWERQSPGK
jgi:hypothetical protein